MEAKESLAEANTSAAEARALSEEARASLAEAGAASAEAGASPAEAGTLSAEAGVLSAEAGASSAEAGASPAEAGAASAEAGAASTEAEASSAEAEAASAEAGAPSAEAGAASAEAGAASAEAGAASAEAGASSAETWTSVKEGRKSLAKARSSFSLRPRQYPYNSKPRVRAPFLWATCKTPEPESPVDATGQFGHLVDLLESEFGGDRSGIGEESVSEVWNNPKVREFSIGLPRTTGKDFFLYQAFWENARRDFLRSDFMNALEKMNKAVAHIPVDDDAILSVLAERASILYLLGAFQRSLMDVAYAEALGAENWPCSHFLTLLRRTKETLKVQVKELEARRQLELRLKRTEPTNSHPLFAPLKWPEIPDPQSGPYRISSAIKMKWNKHKKQHFVAERRIVPGDVLLRERPLMCGVHLRLTKHVCPACFAILKYPNQTYPCETCTEVSYCSPTCLTSPADFHRSECGIIQFFSGLRYQDIPTSFVYHIYRFIDGLLAKARTASRSDLVKRSWFEHPAGPLGVLHSSTVVRGRPPTQPTLSFTVDPLNVLASSVLVLKFIFMTRGEFFRDRAACEVLYELLLAVFENNGQVITEQPNVAVHHRSSKGKRRKKTPSRSTASANVVTPPPSPGDVCQSALDLLGRFVYRLSSVMYPHHWASEIRLIDLTIPRPPDYWNGSPMGFGLYPLATLASHDCFANAICTFRGRELILTAIRSIPRGTPITVCRTPYGNLMFTRTNRRDRFQILQNSCGVDACHCRTCEQDWPTTASDGKNLVEDDEASAYAAISKDIVIGLRCDDLAQEIMTQRIGYLERAFERGIPSSEYLNALRRLSFVFMLRGNMMYPVDDKEVPRAEPQGQKEAPEEEAAGEERGR